MILQFMGSFEFISDTRTEDVSGNMKIIEIRPAKKFKGAWVAFEAPAVQPAFKTVDPKSDAIDYAKSRFGGSSGEIHVYDEAGENIVEKIPIDGRKQYGQPQMVAEEFNLRNAPQPAEAISVNRGRCFP